MLKIFFNKIKEIYINRVLMKIRPTYIAQRRIESYVKSKINGVHNKQEYLFWVSQHQDGETMMETKKRVFASLPRAEGVLRGIQQQAFTILCEIDRICHQNNINYWVMGGTIVGSIRHGGFVPWDDDVDLGMMRRDFDALKKLLESSDKLEIIDFYNFKGLYRIPKICIKNSPEKLAIDIIVFDYDVCSHYQLPENANREEQFDIVWNEQIPMRKKYSKKLKSLKLQYLDVVKTDIVRNPKKLDKITKITNKYVKKCDYAYDDGDYIIWGVDNFTSKAPDKRRVYLKDDIFPLCEIEFEGKKFKAPKKYNEMIVRELGNIWSFPNDAGNPKFFNDTQLEEIYNNNKQAMENVGLALEELK